jgi:DNA-binding transcriptional MerR regulator
MGMDNAFVKIGEAAAMLGCSIATMRQWARTGELVPDWKTKGGTRFYSVARLLEKVTRKDAVK